MKRSFGVVSFLAALALVLGWMGNAMAEVSKPMATLAARSYNEFIDNMKTIGDVASNPAFATAIEFPIQFWVGQEMMDAVNKDALIGGVLQQVNDTQGLLLCIPVEDPELLADFIIEKNFSGTCTEEEDGVFVLESDDSVPLYLKKVDKWTCIVTEREQLASIPEDVVSMFPRYEENTISLTANLAALPDEMKDLFLMNFREGATLGVAEKIEGESDEDYKLRSQQAEASAKAIENLFNSISCYYMGLSVDADAKTMTLDVKVDCVPDTDYAKLCVASQELKPRFTGFVKTGALLCGYSTAVKGNLASEMNNQQLETILNAIQSTEEESELGKALLDAVKPVLEALEAQEVQRLGFLAEYTEDGKNAVVAVEVTDAENLVPKALDSILELTKKEAGDKFKPEWVTEDTTSCEGITFRVVTVPLEAMLAEEELEEVKAFFGDTIQFVVGYSSDALYAGAGTSPIAALKNALALENETEVPAFVSASSLQFMQYLNDMTEFQAKDADPAGLKTQRNIQKVVTELLKSADERDITIESSYLENGTHAKITLQEGLLKLIGNIPSFMMMAQ